MRILKLIIVLTLTPFICSCGILNQNTNQNQEQQSEEIPQTLQKIEEDLEQVFLVLDGPSAQIKQNKQSPTNSEKQNTDSEQNEQDSQSKQSDTQTENLTLRLSEAVQTLHLSWNEYMPELTAKGAGKEIIDGFSIALNDLTKISSEADRPVLLIAANKVYKYIPDFYALYKSRIPADLKRVSYYTRNIILYSAIEDWTNTNTNLTDLKAAWSLVKNALPQQEEVTKLDLSIYELEKVIKDKDKILIKTKGEITLKNTQSLLEFLD